MFTVIQLLDCNSSIYCHQFYNNGRPCYHVLNQYSISVLVSHNIKVFQRCSSTKHHYLIPQSCRRLSTTCHQDPNMQFPGRRKRLHLENKRVNPNEHFIFSGQADNHFINTPSRFHMKNYADKSIE